MYFVNVTFGLFQTMTLTTCLTEWSYLINLRMLSVFFALSQMIVAAKFEVFIFINKRKS